MPIVIRTPGRDIFAGSYCFPADSHAIEDYPWLCMREDDGIELCDICSCLNFDWLFSHSLYEYGGTNGKIAANISDGIRLGSYIEVASRSSCEFCKLLIHALDTGADYEMLSEKDSWAERDIYIMNYAYSSSGIAMSPDSKTSEYLMRIGVQLKSIDDQNSVLSFGTRTIMIQRIEPLEDIVYGGLVLSSTPTRLANTILDWMTECSESRPEADEMNVRLIDISKKCITMPTQYQVQDYVALSYTWGKIDPLTLNEENMDELAEEGALDRSESRLPETIRDAIRLCGMIQQRYLWVDSLCIVQDTRDKHDQIRQMDRIYRHAVLTVIAAAGGDGNAGLPGVSNARQTKQKIINMKGMTLANVLPHLEHSLAHSVWQGRGWTFQEGLLSSRKLIFTQDQIYYHCAHGECSEDTNSNLHKSCTTLASRDIPLRLAFDNVSNWTLYRNVMAEYCKRELSYESDVLNAFAGIAAYLSRNSFLNSAFFSGIPACSLEVGMLWQPTGRLRRRRNLWTGRVIFPSWSWAGWDGPMEYVDAVDFDNVFERSVSCIDLSAERGESLKTSLPDRLEAWERRVTGPMDEVYYIHKDCPESLWFAHPIEEYQFPDGHRRNLYSNIEPIQVFADMVELRLTGEHADLWFRSEECDEGDHQMCRLQVFDSQNRKAGTVVMDGATFDSTDFSNSIFTFVKISQTTLAPGRDDPSWDDSTKTYAGKPGEPALNPRPLFDPEEEEFDQSVYDPNICWCLYNVLVVKYNEGGVAERIAMGQVHIHAFDGAGPIRKILFLG